MENWDLVTKCWSNLGIITTFSRVLNVGQLENWKTFISLISKPNPQNFDSRSYVIYLNFDS